MKVFSWKGDKEVEYSTIDSIKYYAKILNTGMMTMDPFNGHIKVWVGGVDFEHFKLRSCKPGKTSGWFNF